MTYIFSFLVFATLLLCSRSHPMPLLPTPLSLPLLPTSSLHSSSLSLRSDTSCACSHYSCYTRSGRFCRCRHLTCPPGTFPRPTMLRSRKSDLYVVFVWLLSTQLREYSLSDVLPRRNFKELNVDYFVEVYGLKCFPLGLERMRNWKGRKGHGNVVYKEISRNTEKGFHACAKMAKRRDVLLLRCMCERQIT